LERKILGKTERRVAIFMCGKRQSMFPLLCRRYNHCCAAWLTPPSEESECPRRKPQTSVVEIEAELVLVNANRGLSARIEKKVQPTLARVWGEDAPAAAEAEA
jgi:hypothetical protein